MGVVRASDGQAAAAPSVSLKLGTHDSKHLNTRDPW